jgi:phosphoribosyl-ATP pyrophosphohydrolase/phosphoribosyl-AMP cyclohydrolase
MLDLSTLKFDAQGLIPAVVIDTETKKVLTLAYMNAESLRISMEEGTTCFWSRSRQQLWRKGETSGNVQHIVSITADCDRDALLVEVRKTARPATSARNSCFNEVIFTGSEPPAFRYAT